MGYSDILDDIAKLSRITINYHLKIEKDSVRDDVRETDDGPFYERVDQDSVRSIAKRITTSNCSLEQSYQLLCELLFVKTVKVDDHGEISICSGSDGIAQLSRDNHMERCGKLFSDGELVYNCRTCQVDNTCVICADCFRNSDHTGHEIIFYRSSGGGCCDCGDDEAWDPRGNCINHGPKKNMPENDAVDSIPQLPEGVSEIGTWIIEEICSEIRMSLGHIFSSYVRCHKDLDVHLEEKFDDMIALDAKSITVVLNNDDVNDFNHVATTLQGIMSETGMKRSELQGKVNAVDSNGRCPVVTLPFIDEEELCGSLKKAKNIRKYMEDRSLVVSVCCDSQKVCERSALAGLNWMVKLCNISQGLASCIVDRFLDAEDRYMIDCSHGETYMRYNCETDYFWPPHDVICGGAQSPKVLCDLVSAFVRYDALIPKQMGKSVQFLWLSLLRDVKFKHFLGNSLAFAHSRLASSSARGLGTKANSFLQLSIQLLNVPSVVQYVQASMKAQCMDVVVEFVQLVTRYVQSCYKTRQEKGKDRIRTTELDYKHAALRFFPNRGRYHAFIYNALAVFCVLPNPLLDPNGPKSKMSSSRMSSLIDLLRATQRSAILSRHQGSAHITKENSVWAHAFHLDIELRRIRYAASLQLAADVSKLFFRNADIAPQILCEIFQSLYGAGFRWNAKDLVVSPVQDFRMFKIDYTDMHSDRCYSITSNPAGKLFVGRSDQLRYEVKGVALPWDKDRHMVLIRDSVYDGAAVSFILPVHRFLGSFVVFLGLFFDSYGQPHESAERLEIDAVKVFQTAASNANIDMLQLLEPVLRVLASAAQIQAQMWRRTGQVMVTIASNYFGLCASAMYQCDVSLLQFMVSTMDTNVLMAALVDKFALPCFFTDWETPLSAQPATEYDIQLCSELFRLLIHIITEIFPKVDAGRRILRRVLIHAVASKSESGAGITFSNVLEFVRSTRLSIWGWSASDAATGVEPSGLEFGRILLDGEDEANAIPSAVLENMLLEIANVSDVKDTSKVRSPENIYTLKPSVLPEVDPLCWNVHRNREDFVYKRLSKHYADSGVSCWPMTSPPLGPPLRIMTAARQLSANPIILNTFVKCTVFNLLVADAGQIIGYRNQESSTLSRPTESFLRNYGNEERKASSEKVSLSVCTSAMHIFTLFVHLHVEYSKQFNEEKTPFLQEFFADVRRTLLYQGACHFSILELMVNLEKLFKDDQRNESWANIKWCNDMLASSYSLIGALRSLLFEEKKTVEDFSQFESQKNEIAKGGSSASKVSKGRKNRKDRAQEARTRALERMKAAQAAAFKMLKEDDDLVGSVEEPLSEENYCALCHDSIEKKPACFLGFAQFSSWGNPLPVRGDAEKCPPELLSIHRKPAGWIPPPDYSKPDSEQDSVAKSEDLRSNNAADSADWSMAHMDVENSNAYQEDDDSNFGEDADIEIRNQQLNMDFSGNGETENVELNIMMEVDAESFSGATATGAGWRILPADASVGHIHLQAGDHTHLDGARDEDDGDATSNPNDPRRSIVHMSQYLGRFGDFAGTFPALVASLLRDRERQINGSNLHGNRPINSEKVVPDTAKDVFVSFCPQAMHISCLSEYVSSLRHDHASFFPPIHSALKTFSCPVCRSISNIIVPRIDNDLRNDDDDQKNHTAECNASKESSEFFYDSEQNMEKRRRLASSVEDIANFLSKNADESRYLCPNFDEAVPKSVVKESMDTLVNAVCGMYDNSIASVFSQSNSLSIGEELASDVLAKKAVCTWKSLAFSVSAREAMQHASCGMLPVATGSADFFELFSSTMFQWSSYFRICRSLSCEWLKQLQTEIWNHCSNVENEESVDDLQTTNLGMPENSIVEPEAESYQGSEAPNFGITGEPEKQDTELNHAHYFFELLTTGRFPSVGGQFSHVARALWPEKSTPGILLEVEDTVVLLVGFLCTLSPSYHKSVGRALALVTLVQGIVHSEETEPEICDSSRRSPRFAIALGWMNALQPLFDKKLTVSQVFYTLFSPLARYLRCCVQLLRIASSHEIVPSTYGDKDEVDFIWENYLGIPPADELFQNPTILRLIRCWCDVGRQVSGPASVKLFNPYRCCFDRTRLTLISLPKKYDELLTLVSKQAVKCPTTGKQMRSPALCLRCGCMVCCNQPCCSRLVVRKDSKRSLGGITNGAGTLHAKACGGGVGAFLVISKCMVVLVHEGYSVSISAPYVDSYGEHDDFLRRGRLLEFYEQAYKKIQFFCANNVIAHQVFNLIRSDNAYIHMHRF